jgi:hypothetical protein
MGNPIIKYFLRLAVIIVSVFSCYSPLALAAHQHAKPKHHKLVAYTTHHGNHHVHAKKITAGATKDNFDFTIGPDNTLVANNTYIPPEPAPIARTVTTISSTRSIVNAPPVMVPTPPPVMHTTPTPVAAVIKLSPAAAPPVFTTRVASAPIPIFGGIAASMHKHLVEFVKKTVATLRYSDYKLGGSKFDTSRGIYVLDCSTFVDHILKSVSPRAYTSLVNATGAPIPATQHYFEFFNELTNNSDDYWNKVNNVEQLRAGDILVFRNKLNHGNQAGGHIMVVMDKPVRDSDVYFVRVADSAPARHSEDTRQKNEAGIGIGTMLLKAAKSGRPFAYAWSAGGLWNKNVNFAMARPTEWD